MRKWVWALLAAATAASPAWAQENIFSSNTTNSTVSVTDGQTFVPLPTTASLGPNTISTGANSQPRSMFYDPIRTQVYAVNTTGGSVVAIDPLRFTTKTLIPTGLAGPLSMATMSPDGRFLYVAGGSSVAGRIGIFRIDLDDFTPAGTSFVGGLVPAGSTTYAPVDVEVLPGKAYFTYTSTFSGTLAVVIFHIGEVDLSTGTFTDLFAVNATSTTAPRAFARMTRSPDSSFVLVAAQTGSAVGTTQWQVPRINPAATPVVDVVSIPTGSANEVVEDFVFTSSGGAPFTLCMLARDDSTYNPRFLTIGATGGPGAVTNGPSVPSGFGGSMTPDLAHNRIFFAHNGSTAFPNHFEILSPPTPAGAFRVANPANSGGPAPQEMVVAPAPPLMQVDFVTQPAAVDTTPFQLEIHGKGFLQGSSRGRVQDNTFGVLTTATTTTVLSDGVLLASFPALTAQNFDVSVVNNDGQLSTLNLFFQGMSNPPQVTLNPPQVLLPPLVSGYSMLSFPQYATVGDLRAAVAAQLGLYNPTQFRIFLWEQTRYLELNDSRLSPSQSIMGTGFFGLSRLGSVLTLSAPDVTLNTTIGQRVVALTPGWNLVSQPWLGGTNNQIAMAALQVTANRDLTGVQFATVSPLISNVAFELVGGQYQTTTALIAGRAYWILNQHTDTVYIIFNQGSVTKPAPPSTTSSTSASPTPPPPPGRALDDSGGKSGGCGLLGAEALLAVLFLRARGRRRLSA